MPISDRPLFTGMTAHADKFSPDENSVYVWGESVEQRSMHILRWCEKVPGLSLCKIGSEASDHFVTKAGGSELCVHLRSESQIDAFWNISGRESVYLDITGLRHSTWAPLLKRALAVFSSVTVVYVEPRTYRASLTPTDTEFYDLSEKIEGVSPLPGFANLRSHPDKVCFVPFLGFEGTRFAHLVSQLDPLGGTVAPVLGLPGFRVEYPFTTYVANRLVLMQTDAWKQIRYATSNCPFDAFYVLEEIAEHFPGHTLRVAPIGTKPHAVGAVLFAVAHSESVELIYDHPIRRAQRTDGMGTLFTYRVSALFSKSK